MVQRSRRGLVPLSPIRCGEGGARRITRISYDGLFADLSIPDAALIQRPQLVEVRAVKRRKRKHHAAQRNVVNTKPGSRNALRYEKSALPQRIVRESNPRSTWYDERDQACRGLPLHDVRSSPPAWSARREASAWCPRVARITRCGRAAPDEPPPRRIRSETSATPAAELEPPL